MNFELTIIIPVYNEEDNLLRVQEELSAFLLLAKKKAKVLFINDGSKDGSQKIIEDICSNHDDFGFIAFDKNYGLSAAIKAGFDTADTPWVGYIDADLQTDPMDFNILLEHADGHELVTGVRADRKDSFVKNMSSKIANGIRRAFTHDGMDDTGCPLKIIRTHVAKKIPMFNGLHRFLPAMVLLQGGRIKQVPVKHFPRTAGVSKFHLWNRLIGPLQDCFAYLWMKKKYLNYTIARKG
ncbi:Undecaprenyl-phosphate 4-deoxy-4-formamido-L-arabinose transferase [compost metagenome]